MHNRQKAVLHKDQALHLKQAWGVPAEQVRYSDDGHWYASLVRFPAALFDPYGYVYFATEADYRSAPMSIGKQISIRKPGISAMPGYVRMVDPNATTRLSLEKAKFARGSDVEGTKTEMRCLRRNRSRSLRDSAFNQARGVCCVCNYDFSKLHNGRGVRVLQVHHRKQLSVRDAPSVTTIADLAVVCANCHMLLHLDPEEALSVDDLRDMLLRDGSHGPA